MTALLLPVLPALPVSSAMAALPPGERDRIEQLLAGMEREADVQFERNGRRVILMVNGLETMRARSEESERLLGLLGLGELLLPPQALSKSDARERQRIG